MRVGPCTRCTSEAPDTKNTALLDKLVDGEARTLPEHKSRQATKPLPSKPLSKSISKRRSIIENKIQATKTTSSSTGSTVGDYIGPIYPELGRRGAPLRSGLPVALSFSPCLSRFSPRCSPEVAATLPLPSLYYRASCILPAFYCGVEPPPLLTSNQTTWSVAHPRHHEPLGASSVGPLGVTRVT